MSYPQNPESIVVQNRFYPKGLTEIDIWNYYQKVKRQLLDQVKFKDLMIFIMININTPIIKRTGETTRFIRLNPSNYDELITGRTISIHTAMRKSEDKVIIDIDSDDFKQSKIAAFEVYNFLLDKFPERKLISDVKIKYTGKTGFHIFCELIGKYDINNLRLLFRKYLLESDLSKKYTVEHKRIKGIPNLDLAPMKERGNYITLYSLSVWGLRCMEVNIKDILKFDPRISKIK